MTGEEAARAIAYFRATWPQSNRWPDESWDYWTDLFQAHGRSYVRIAFRRLMRDPAFREFPPGIAAFIQEFDRLEGRLRDALEIAVDSLAAAQEIGDEERAEKAERWIAQTQERLAR